MASAYEKSIKGATKPKLAPPKSKYIEVILQATHTGESGAGDVFRTLQHRIRDSTWTIAFKGLIVAHLMIREGEQNVTLRYLSTSQHRKQLAVHSYAEVQTQGRNLKNYSHYLIERAKSFSKAKVDYVATGEGRLKRLSVDKGLLMETETVQSVIQALLQCDLFNEDGENEVTLTAFRLLTMDLLALFHVMNEGAINVLEHYFEMSRPDAERALAIYKTFTRQTEQVVKYLSIARQHEQSTRLEIPKIRHAPISLAASLEEYLNDKDFEINRRQFLVQQEAKRTGKPLPAVSKSTQPESSSAKRETAGSKSTSQPVQQDAKASAKPAVDLIDFDFFESIEQNQQAMAQDPRQFQQNMFNTGYSGSPQPTGFVGQTQPFQPTQTGFYSGASTNPFNQQPSQFANQFTGMAPQQGQQYTGAQFQNAAFQNPQVQAQPTGAGFGGYTPQPNEQNNFSYGQQQFSGNQSQLQPQATNPFRQSTMASPTGQVSNSFTGMASDSTTGGRNPFAPIPENDAFTQPVFQPSGPSQYQQTASPPPVQPQPTGTNPFARPAAQQTSSPPPAGITSHATGSTNPFRQSAFVNQATGQGWQQGPQPSLGGLEHLPTIPVFPRPQPQQQQQQQQQPWG